jgi:hypothetical protein
MNGPPLLGTSAHRQHWRLELLWTVGGGGDGVIYHCRRPPFH